MESMDREFAAGLEACRPELLALCRGLLWNRGDLEDAVQEVVVQALRAWPRFEPGTNFRAWLLRVAVNTIFNLNRKRRTAPVPGAEPAAEPGLEEELGLEEAYEAVLADPGRVVAAMGAEVRGAVAGLSDVERSVLLLRSIAEMKYQEIAEHLGIPLGSVMGYLGRARARLRRTLAEYVHEV